MELTVPESVRVVNLAGEELRRALVDQIYELKHVERVLNLYGPSEVVQLTQLLHQFPGTNKKR